MGNDEREPIKKNSIEKKNRIIEKGFELMCNKGYHNVSCVDIAKYSNVSTGIIYQYFKDKRDIFIEGVKDYSNKIMFPMIDILDTKSIDKKNLENIISDMIDSFINTMCDVYQDEIKLMGYAEKGSRLLAKVTSLGNKLIIVLSVAIILLILINSKIFKRKDFSILLYTSSFILLFTYYYINNNIDIKNIFVYSSLVSKIAKNVINNILNSFIIIAIIYIVLGIILGLFKKIKKS